MTKIRNPKQNRFGHLKLEFRAYLEFVIWDFKLHALCSMPFAELLRILHQRWPSRPGRRPLTSYSQTGPLLFQGPLEHSELRSIDLMLL